MGHITSQSQLPEWKNCDSGSQSNSQQLNEIMTMIYRRFTEKSAEEWRQIYKVGDSN